MCLYTHPGALVPILDHLAILDTYAYVSSSELFVNGSYHLVVPAVPSVLLKFGGIWISCHSLMAHFGVG